MNEKRCLLDVTVEKVPCQDEDGQRMSKYRDTFDYETVFGTNVVTKDGKQIWTFQVNSYATSTVIGITPNDRIKPNKCNFSKYHATDRECDGELQYAEQFELRDNDMI
eukprot:1044303_1